MRLCRPPNLWRGFRKKKNIDSHFEVAASTAGAGGRVQLAFQAICAFRVIHNRPLGLYHSIETFIGEDFIS
jgi:hypothetical protein